MLNQVVLVGRIAKDMKLSEKENGRKVTKMDLAIPRSFKNENGEYDTDFVPVFLYSGVAENTVNYCKKGDLVGIKGRLTSENNKVFVNAERVTFLSSKPQEKEED